MGRKHRITNTNLDDSQLSARVAGTTEVPAQAVLLIWANLEDGYSVPAFQEGLVEPVHNPDTPKHLLVACCLSRARQDKKVLLQVINVSTDTARIHKGTKLGDFTPVQQVYVVDNHKIFMSHIQSTVDLRNVNLSKRFSKVTKSYSHFPKLLLSVLISKQVVKETMAKRATQSRN